MLGAAQPRHMVPEYVNDALWVERQNLFVDFLNSPEVYHGDLTYQERTRQMLKTKSTRLIVSINDLRHFNRGEIAVGVLQQPLEWIPPIEAALSEVAKLLFEPDETQLDIDDVVFHVGFEGSFGELQTTPRMLSARLLSHMLCLEGIVTSCSLIRPKLLRSVHWVESTKAFMVKEYWDATVLNGMPPGAVSNAYPTETDDHKRLSSEFGLSQYRDYQTVTVQEMPEKAPPGQLPRSIDVILDGDLVDRLKPGDRSQIVGVYKAMASAFNGQVPSTFRAVLVANNARILGSETLRALTVSGTDLDNIRQVSRRPDVFELLSRSIAPSIYGHEYIKKAVLLMLLGGVERNLSNGTHIRGDINVLMVGDPSTAKSQMLRYVLGIAPLAIATTGRGSSGVGLTAAVTHDKETGERRLEAGAMVLADRGIVCIDEFDKMSDLDRVAIHEVMEQQTATISKAGIHASLNARCSVIAAANPIWGQYREHASPQENIRLPDSLLSRFDLLFVVLDWCNEEHDRRISEHVLRMHRWVPPGVPEGVPIPERDFIFGEDDAIDDEGDESVYLKTSTPNYFPDDDEDNEADDDDTLTNGFVRKYVHYARTNVVPVLTKAASDHIVAAYTTFRTEQPARGEALTFPVTPRTLETLIRLSTAHAKARLSSRVERKDVKVAEEMVRFCLYKEVLKKKKKRQSKKARQHSGGEDSDSGNEGEERTPAVLSEKDPLDAPMQSLSLAGPLQRQPPSSAMAVDDIVSSFIAEDKLIADSLPYTQPSAELDSQPVLDRAGLVQMLSRFPRNKALRIADLGIGEQAMPILQQLADENKLMLVGDSFILI